MTFLLECTKQVTLWAVETSCLIFNTYWLADFYRCRGTIFARGSLMLLIFKQWTQRFFWAIEVCFCIWRLRLCGMKPSQRGPEAPLLVLERTLSCMAHLVDHSFIKLYWICLCGWYFFCLNLLCKFLSNISA